MTKKITQCFKKTRLLHPTRKKENAVFFFLKVLFSYIGIFLLLSYFYAIPSSCGEEVPIMGNHFTFLNVFLFVFLTDILNYKHL